jgi:hypothetical protein
MTNTLTGTDRLRIERAAADDVGTAEAFRRLGDLRRLAAETWPPSTAIGGRDRHGPGRSPASSWPISSSPRS